MGEAYGGTVRIGSQSVGGRLEALELRAEDILRSTGQTNQGRRSQRPGTAGTSR